MIPIVNQILNIADKFIPDAKQKLKFKQELIQSQNQLTQAAIDASAKSDEGQAKINLADTKKSFFYSGWRPSVSWICVAGLIYDYIIYNHLTFYLSIKFPEVDKLPEIDSHSLLTMIFGLLGLGTMRTLEKIKLVHQK